MIRCDDADDEKDYVAVFYWGKKRRKFFEYSRMSSYPLILTGNQLKGLLERTRQTKDLLGIVECAVISSKRTQNRFKRLSSSGGLGKVH